MDKLVLRFIYLPYLLVSIVLIVLYTFLNWLLLIKLQMFSINEDVSNAWLPIILPGLATFFLLVPRLKLLNLKTAKGSWIGFYSVIIWMSIAIPLLITQAYIETASGKLTALDSISQINKYPLTKYYSLRQFYIDKKFSRFSNAVDVSGKYNENLNLHVYVTLPVFESAADTAKSDCLVWLGKEYRKQISNHGSQEEKEKMFQDFLEESNREFVEDNFNQFIYLDRIGNTDSRGGFINALKESPKFNGSNSTILLAVNDPFENRNGDKFAWIFRTFGIGAFILLIIVLIPKTDETVVNLIKTGKDIKDKQAFNFFKLFIPHKGFYATSILIDINILIFIVMVFDGLGVISFQTSDLLKWGANYKPLTINGQWWRLFTSIFLHGGVMHILGNMYGLIFAGLLLEPAIGKIRFIVVYLVTGIFASISSILWYDATVSVGASGAIFGLYGVILLFFLTNVFPKVMNQAFLLSVLIFVGLNLVMGLTGGVDNAAHVGGLVTGFVIGLILYPTTLAF